MTLAPERNPDVVAAAIELLRKWKHDFATDLVGDSYELAERLRGASPTPDQLQAAVFRELTKQLTWPEFGDLPFPLHIKLTDPAHTVIPDTAVLARRVAAHIAAINRIDVTLERLRSS